MGLPSPARVSCFNPRAYGRRDVAALAEVRVFVVSIHAPTGGATAGPTGGVQPRSGFNPRAYGRRDSSFSKYSEPEPPFQSTRLREARHGSRTGYYYRSRFNPRAYGRRDPSRAAGCSG